MCGVQQKPQISQARIVTETREKEYRNEAGFVVGRGREIVKELVICPTCEKKEKEEMK
jgi:hypothetical protein